jgi:mRNA degradation ribonuclease J1/J2
VLVPVHGGARHLIGHAALARALGIAAAVVRDGERNEIADGALRPAGTLPASPHAIENGARVPAEVLEARRAAGRAGVLSIAGDRVTLAGISGVGAAELEAALRAGGPSAAARLVRKRTGKRPHVIVHDP